MSSRTPNQVVRLTRAIDVPGHTAMLVRVMTHVGYRWYPEYTVEEQYRDFNQSQYLCTVRIYPSYPGATEPIHWTYGLGVSIEMAVQDAAYSMMTIIRARHALLQNTEFGYMPASLPGALGYYTGLYTDASHEPPSLQTTAQILEDRDREVRALRMELFATRARHWTTLTLLAPVIQRRGLQMDFLFPPREPLAHGIDPPDVGGYTPRRGPRLPPPVGPRPHPCPNGPQPSRAWEFPDPHVQLPGHGGNLYEDYYGGDELL